jgi:hypothetical protein
MRTNKIGGGSLASRPWGSSAGRDESRSIACMVQILFVTHKVALL